MKHLYQQTLEQAVFLARLAANRGVNTGMMNHGNLLYLSGCTHCHYPTGTQVILTRDTGHHACGWWKNPEYERCLHLSLCFRDVETGEPRDKDAKLTGRWIEAVFGEAQRLVWSEPPVSPEGKQRDVWHYRVFYADEGWTTPLLPRGEYTKEFTEAGWLSFSDMQEKLRVEEARELEVANNR